MSQLKIGDIVRVPIAGYRQRKPTTVIHRGEVKEVSDTIVVIELDDGITYVTGPEKVEKVRKR